MSKKKFGLAALGILGVAAAGFAAGAACVMSVMDGLSEEDDDEMDGCGCCCGGNGDGYAHVRCRRQDDAGDAYPAEDPDFAPDPSDPELVNELLDEEASFRAQEALDKDEDEYL